MNREDEIVQVLEFLLARNRQLYSFADMPWEDFSGQPSVIKAKELIEKLKAGYSSSQAAEKIKTDYPLIPMNEITDEARKIAVAWMDCEDKNWIGNKHKLASDIQNYARRYSSSQASNGLQWVKASEGHFPTKSGSYHQRHPYEDGRWHGWWSYIVPEAIDKDYWIKMGYEWLDESASSQAKPVEGDGWISVEYDLPKHFNSVVAYSKKGITVITFMDRGTKKLDDYFLADESDYFTHWRPLPTPPQSVNT